LFGANRSAQFWHSLQQLIVVFWVTARWKLSQLYKRPEGREEFQMAPLAELSRLAETINKETDAYTQSLAQLENKLNKLNLGIEVWVALRASASTGNPKRDSYVRTLLGYAKTSEGWGFAVQDERVERGYFQGDSDCPWENTYEETPPKLLLKASREVRIEAAGRIEELLQALQSRAEEVVPTLRQASAIAKQI
jgi:hypothetical protein